MQREASVALPARYIMRQLRMVGEGEVVTSAHGVSCKTTHVVKASSKCPQHRKLCNDAATHHGADRYIIHASVFQAKCFFLGSVNCYWLINILGVQIAAGSDT